MVICYSSYRKLIQGRLKVLKLGRGKSFLYQIKDSTGRNY